MALLRGADHHAAAQAGGAHIDSFYSRSAAPAAAYAPFTGERDTDVVVLGGGLAGVNTALACAQRGLRVTLLEANRVGWAASGRNGGFVHPGFSLDLFSLASRVGISHARALWQLSHDALGTIRRRVEAWAPGCASAAGAVPLAPGMLTASWFNDEAGTQAEVETGNQLLGRDYFQFWPRDRVRGLYRTSRYYDGVYDPDSFHFHSLNYAQAVAQAARCAGAWWECSAWGELTRRCTCW
jgi:gamma-glutamylputrescine oxidase